MGSFNTSLHNHECFSLLKENNAASNKYKYKHMYLDNVNIYMKNMTENREK